MDAFLPMGSGGKHQGTADLFLHKPRYGSNREGRDACGAGHGQDFGTKPYRPSERPI